MRKRIVETVDLRIDVGRLRAIDRLAGGEDARRQDQAGALIFGGDEDLARPVRGIVERRGAEREVLHHRPVTLRHQLVGAGGTMGMGIDQAGDNGLPGGIDGSGPGGNGGRRTRADRDDAVAADHHHAIVDDAAVRARHGDEARAGDRDRAGRLGGCLLHRQRHAGGGRYEAGRPVDARGAGEQARGFHRVERRPQAPVQSRAIVRPVEIIRAAGADLGDRKRPRIG